jgi:hypothetical protein
MTDDDPPAPVPVRRTWCPICGLSWESHDESCQALREEET